MRAPLPCLARSIGFVREGKGGLNALTIPASAESFQNPRQGPMAFQQKQARAKRIAKGRGCRLEGSKAGTGAAGQGCAG